MTTVCDNQSISRARFGSADCYCTFLKRAGLRKTPKSGMAQGTYISAAAASLCRMRTSWNISGEWRSVAQRRITPSITCSAKAIMIYKRRRGARRNKNQYCQYLLTGGEHLFSARVSCRLKQSPSEWYIGRAMQYQGQSITTGDCMHDWHLAVSIDPW